MNQKYDLKLINILTNELYNGICFDIGNMPPVYKLTEFFIPSANMIRNDADTPEIMMVTDFIKSYSERIAKGEIQSFSEVELKHITEIFGKIAHRFSTYKTKYILNNSEYNSIGINSIQYIKIGEDWKISSIVWNNQTNDLRISDKYLSEN